MIRIACLGTAMAVLCLLLTAAPAPGVEVDGWQLRAHGFWVDTNKGLVVRSGEARAESGAGSGVGGGISAEVRFAERWGVEAGAFSGTGNDLRIEWGAPFITDTMSFSASFAGLNFHSRPESRLDFYGGPLLAYVSYDSIRLARPRGDFPFGFIDTVAFLPDHDLALGAQLGLDVPLGEARRWFFSTGIKYLDATLETGEPGPRSSSSFDPLLVGLGVGYAF